MLQSLKNVMVGALSFLRTGDCPPGTPSRLQEQVENVNHLSSKKFFIVLSSVVILATFYYSSVAILFIIPKIPVEIITAYTTIFTKTTEILAIIIASYIGCQTVVDFKYKSNSETIQENYSETVKKEETINANQKEDDYELN
jgi:hypothetical protein